MLKTVFSRIQSNSHSMRRFSTSIESAYITTAELDTLLKKNPSNLRILDCTVGPNTLEKHSAKHIKGS